MKAHLYDILELQKLSLSELQEIAKKLEIDGTKSKQENIYAILNHQQASESSIKK